MMVHKGGREYKPYAAFCLQAQHYPDVPHHVSLRNCRPKGWPSVLCLTELNPMYLAVTALNEPRHDKIC